MPNRPAPSTTLNDVLNGDAQFAVLCGDATEVLKGIPDGSIGVCYCDPPYGLSAQSTADIVACLTAWLAGTTYHHGKSGMMGKDWDGWVPGPEAWREVLRVLKPGAYCVAFSSTRTVDMLGMAMRLAGLELREGWAWVFGSGFPKNLDVGKALDKIGGIKTSEFKTWLQGQVAHSGLSRADIDAACGFTMKFDTPYEKDPGCWGSSLPTPEKWVTIKRVLKINTSPFDELLDGIWRGRRGAQTSDNTAMSGSNFERNDKGDPTTNAAKLWSGYGTTTKPAYEPLVVTRKPPDGTIASNVLQHGCGALNIDGARIGTQDDLTGNHGNHALGSLNDDGWKPSLMVSPGNPAGRFPASLALIHDEGCVLGTKKVKGDTPHDRHTQARPITTAKGTEKERVTTGYGDADGNGTETIDPWQCTDTCAVAELGRQSGTRPSTLARFNLQGPQFYPSGADPTKSEILKGVRGEYVYGDTGTAARFFYQGKASANDRLAYLTCTEGCKTNNTVVPAKEAKGTTNCPLCGQPQTVYQHCTVKPLALANYHAKLLSLPKHVQPIAIVPFCGTGIEAKALLDVGFRVIAIDIDPRHCAMTQYRLEGNQAHEEPMQEQPTGGVTSASFEDLLGLGNI